MASSWLNVQKDSKYASANRPTNKETKKPDEWGLHVSFSEMVFEEKDGEITIIALADSEPSGVMVSQANKEKIKWPMAFKTVIKADSDSVGEKALAAVLKGNLEQGKCYSGFYNLSDTLDAAKVVATGQKTNGQTPNEKEISFLQSQVCNVMEVERVALTDDLISEAKKEQPKSKGNWGSASETTAEKVKTRNIEVRALLGLKAEDDFTKVISEIEATATATGMHPNTLVTLITGLLA